MSRNRPIPVGLPRYVAALATLLQTLPGVGEKAAFRHAVSLALGDPVRARGLGEALVRLHEEIGPCDDCGGLAERKVQPAGHTSAICAVCGDVKRDDTIVCVVARVPDMLAIERSGAMRGRYVVLGAMVSPIDGVELADLPIHKIRRAINRGVREVILALPATVEGQATALMVQRELADTGVRMTRIASGVPHGGDLEFSDQVTLRSAIDGRGEVKT